MSVLSDSRIIILGAGYAGMTAALRLSRRLRSRRAQITLINSSPVFVERIRLHQVAAAQSIRPHQITDLLRGTGVSFMQGWVLCVSPETNEVIVQTDHGVQTLTYDTLLYALGSTTDKDSVPGVREHTLAIGDPADSPALRSRLAELTASGGQVIVAGGGLTGIETASELAEAYPSLRIKLVTAGSVGAGLSQRGRAHLRGTFERMQVALEENMKIDHVEADTLVTAEGREVPFDLCVWAGPMKATDLARDSGLEVNDRGQIWIDETLRSVSHRSIYAIGDAAAFMPGSGVKTRMACATAGPMASHAVDNILREMNADAPKPFRFRYLFQCISLGRSNGLIQAVRADDSPVERVLTGRLAAVYKEMICRFAAMTVTRARAAEYYMWPQ